MTQPESDAERRYADELARIRLTEEETPPSEPRSPWFLLLMLLIVVLVATAQGLNLFHF